LAEELYGALDAGLILDVNSGGSVDRWIGGSVDRWTNGWMNQTGKFGTRLAQVWRNGFPNVYSQPVERDTHSSCDRIWERSHITHRTWHRVRV